MYITFTYNKYNYEGVTGPKKFFKRFDKSVWSYGILKGLRVKKNARNDSISSECFNKYVYAEARLLRK